MKIIRRLGTALLAAVLCASVLCVPALADGEDVTISLSQTTIYLPVGQSQKVTATASDGKAVTWVSLTSGVASVDSAGNITALAEGAATVQAKSADGSAVANCKVIAYMAFPSYALREPEPGRVIFRHLDQRRRVRRHGEQLRNGNRTGLWTDVYHRAQRQPQRKRFHHGGRPCGY